MADLTLAPASYELWENRSGNLLAEFDTLDEALRFVRDTVTDAGLAAVLSWSLHRSDATAPLKFGEALAVLAGEHLPV